MYAIGNAVEVAEVLAHRQRAVHAVAFDRAVTVKLRAERLAAVLDRSHSSSVFKLRCMPSQPPKRDTHQKIRTKLDPSPGEVDLGARGKQ